MDAFPYYLAIGMSYDLYWHGDPRLVTTYRKAHEMKIAQKNEEMWMQGIYNLRAFKTVAEAVVIGLSGKNGSKPGEYPTEPFPITEAEQKAATERRKKRTLEWVKHGQD